MNAGEGASSVPALAESRPCSARPQWLPLIAQYPRCRALTHPGEGCRELDRSDARNHRRRAGVHNCRPLTTAQGDVLPL